MTAKAFLVTLAAGMLAGCATADTEMTMTAPEAQSRPNIIVIMADDLGYGDLSSYGAELIKTPNIDRLATEGVKMTSFYAGAAVCTPSRAALMTGRYPIRTGAQHVFRAQFDDGMEPGEVTLAEMLGEAGYATGMVGKWHLGHQLEHWPTNQGFDDFYGVAYSNDMFPFDLFDGTKRIESPVDQTTLTARYADAAVDFIEQNADEPFFLYYAESFPHIPLFHPPANAGRSEAGTYGDVVETIDDAVGDILDTLERLEIEDNTLIFFTSDNGPWFEGSSGDLRDRKGGTYLGGFQVPMLVRWPDRLPAGSETSEMAMSIDLLPTIAAATGATAPTDRTIDGRNILPVLEAGAATPHDVLFFFDGNDIVAARNADYRLVVKAFYRNYPVEFRNNPYLKWLEPLLFDMKIDPAERYSMASRNPEVVAELLEKITEMTEATAELHREPNPMMPPPGALHGPQFGDE